MKKFFLQIGSKSANLFAMEHFWSLGGGVVAVLLIIQVIFAWYEGSEPDPIVVEAVADKNPGVVMVDTIARVAETLYKKPGGYLANARIPPGVFMDDIPNWELGVLQEVRRTTHALGHQFAMSHAAFQEDTDLANAEIAFDVDAHSWIFPRAENSFREGVLDLRQFSNRLKHTDSGAVFLPTNAALMSYLQDTAQELVQMSALLNSALPQPELEGDRNLPASARTSWWNVDDHFYFVRGQCWALAAVLQALRNEYSGYLIAHHADLSLLAMIRELQAAGQPVYSPMILNGSGFGLFANHSLTLANYVDRAQLDDQDVLALIRTN